MREWWGADATELRFEVVESINGKGAGEVSRHGTPKSPFGAFFLSPSGHKQAPTAFSVNEDTPTTPVFVQSFIEYRRIVAARNVTNGLLN